MTPGHKIEQAVFNLSFCSRTELVQESAALGSLVRQKLMPVVDEVLSERALADHVICIDKLKVELGCIRLADLKSRLERELRRHLDALLPGGAEDSSPPPGKPARIMPLIRRRLDLVTHFLQTGTLSVSLALEPGWDLGRCLKSVLEHEPSDFRKFLLKTSHQPGVIRRLARQFPEDTLRQVVRLLGPAQSDNALATVERILRNSVRSSSEKPRVALTVMAWELLLDYLLHNPNINFSPTAVDRWIGPRLKVRVTEPQESLAVAEALSKERPPLGDDVVAEGDDPPPIAANAEETRWIIQGYDLYEALWFYMRHGVLPWPAETLPPDMGVSQIVHDLCAGYPGKLRKLAAELRHSPGFCQSLTDKLSGDVMQQFITSMIKAGTPGQTSDESTLIQSIMENADQTVDRKAYFAAVLRSIVTRQPIDLKQSAARPQKEESATAREAGHSKGKDPDLIRARLTAMLKSDGKLDASASEFAHLLGDLETKFPKAHREYLGWLTKFPPLVLRAKEMIASLPAGAGTQTTIMDRLDELSSPSQSSQDHLSDSDVADDATVLLDRRTDNPSTNSRGGAGKINVNDMPSVLPAEIVKDAAQKDLLGQRSPTGRSVQDNIARADEAEDALAILDYLASAPEARPISKTFAKDLFRPMIRQGSETLYAELRTHLKDIGVREKTIGLLSERWLTRLLAGLQPNLHGPMQTHADVIEDACLSANLFERPGEINSLKWEFIFKYVAREGNRPFNPKVYRRSFIAFMGEHAGAKDKENIAAVLSEHLEDDHTASVIPRPLSAAAKRAIEAEATEIQQANRATRIDQTAEDMPDAIAVQNAGMVIAAPYLPQLGTMLGLIEGKAFKARQAAQRAVHLLQFMTDESTASPEYELVLNKILCGLDLSEPIEGGIEISDEEREVIDGLIQGMIGHWKKIGQTSVEGFRESFLQRRGRLILKDDAWHLTVKERAFDMLLDSIPWGFATIKHPWMGRVLYVKWR